MDRAAREKLLTENLMRIAEIAEETAARHQLQLEGTLPWPDDDPPRSLPQRQEKAFGDDPPPSPEMLAASRQRHTERLQREASTEQSTFTSDLEKYLDSREAALIDGTVEYVREQLREETRKLELKILEMRVEIAGLKTALAHERSVNLASHRHLRKTIIGLEADVP